MLGTPTPETNFRRTRTDGFPPSVPPPRVSVRESSPSVRSWSRSPRGLATLQYSDATARLLVTNDSGTDDASGGDQVTDDGCEATHQLTATTHLVSRECGGHRYAVVGSGATRDRLLDVAASIECA